MALGGLAGCSTVSKTSSENLKFFSGKAQVVDKNKNKVEWVYFNSSVQAPDKLRLDVSMGLLGIPLGTLVIDGKQATLISLFERKAYVTQKGDQVLEKLMKTNISTADILAVFSEKLPLAGSWVCSGGAENQSCKQEAVQLDWQKNEKNDRKMVIESTKSKVTFMYQPARSGPQKFDVEIPQGFTVIQL